MPCAERSPCCRTLRFSCYVLGIRTREFFTIPSYGYCVLRLQNGGIDPINVQIRAALAA